MKRLMMSVVRTIAMPALIGMGMLAVAGCDESHYKHDPAAGLGGLVVDNRTGDEVRVYVDGSRLLAVDAFDDDATDLEPGDYRVVLIQKNGNREYRTYVDVLEGELTVMIVELVQGSLTEYKVTVKFD